MDALLGALQSYWQEQIADHGSDIVTRITLAVVAGVISWALYRLVRGTIRRALRRTPIQATHANVRLLIGRCLQFVFIAIGALWMLSILGIQPNALIAVLGAFTLAVSLAMQDVLKNLVAGLYILLERPFTIGEHIDFRTYSGVVETIELRTTVLRTASGQRVVIPNAMLFADALVNRSAFGRQLLRIRVVVPLPKAPASEAVPADQPPVTAAATPGATATAGGRSTEGARVARGARPAEGARPVARPRPVDGVGPADGTGGPASLGRESAAGKSPAPPTQAIPAEQVVDELYHALRAVEAEAPAARRGADGRGTPPRVPASPPPEPVVLVESLSGEKVTLRAEVWTYDVRETGPRIAWAVRRRLPVAEITVLE